MNKPTLLILLLCMSFSTFAENMALIMGISAYERSPLSGVYKDIDNAKKFAESMNIPQKNIYKFSDEQLTLIGLKNTLEQFANTVNNGDRVFIYFSGHGTSTSQNGSCNQGIVSQDMQVLYRQDFQKYIDRITKKSGKTLVFLDTCFSGGVVEQMRSITKDSDGFPKAKYLDIKSADGEKTCEADNIESSRGMRDFASVAKATPNYYFLGASSATEVAIDGGQEMGGWATSALLSCVRNSDWQKITSGILTMAEVKICAQDKINQLIKVRKEKNSNFPYTAMSLTVGSGSGSGAMPVGFTFTNPSNANQKIEPIKLFNDIVENSDQTKKLVISTLKPQVKINKDNLELSIESPVDGYLTLFIAGSSQKIYQIFPDTIDDDSYIRANHKIQLPKKVGHSYPSQGPVGKNTILAVVSSTKGKFNALGIPVGNYRAIDNIAKNAKNITLTMLSPVSSCGRDFGSIVKQEPECSTSYSAALLDVLEVE